jgi:RNA polymerase sigma-70 factor (ECF subfamily)
MHSPQSAEFVTLWSEHSRIVYAYIYSLVFHAADADDIFQETSLTLFQKFDEFELGTNFQAWAYSVARNKVSQFRERGRLHESVDEELLEAIDESARTQIDLSGPRFAALRKCIARLSAKDQKLIKLRYERGAKVADVGEKVGRTAGAIYKSLTRIHDLLLECVRRRLEEGIDS